VNTNQPADDDILNNAAAELQKPSPKSQEEQPASPQEKGTGPAADSEKPTNRKNRKQTRKNTTKKRRKRGTWYMPREDLVPAKESKDEIIEFLINNLYEAEVYRRVHRDNLGIIKVGWEIWRIARCFEGTLPEFYERVRAKLEIESIEEAQVYADKVMLEVLRASTNAEIREAQAIEIFETIDRYREEMQKCMTRAFGDPDASPVVLAELILLMLQPRTDG